MALNNKFLDIGVDYMVHGLRARADATFTQGFRIMRNMRINSNGGIGNRLGIKMYKPAPVPHKQTDGFYSFRKASTRESILMSACDGKMYYLSNIDGAWHENRAHGLSNPGFTVGSSFAFKEHYNTKELNDYIYFCNAREHYMRWSGLEFAVVGDHVSTDTVLTLNSVLYDDILYSGTASASSATTLTINTGTWAASQWVGFYVYIKTGTHEGAVRKITANTFTQITFDTLTTDPGNCEFEVRVLKMPDSGFLLNYNGHKLAYTLTGTHNQVTVPATLGVNIPDGSVVSDAFEHYTGAPRGNLLETLYTQMYVGNVRNGLRRDSYDAGGKLSGNLAGDFARPSVYRSKLREANDFTFSSPRAAGEGDIVSLPSDGAIKDISRAEDRVYVFMERGISRLSFGESGDIPSIDNISTGVGILGKTFSGGNDLFFINSNKQFSSVGRVENKDSRPQSMDQGFNIERLLNKMDFNNARGIRHGYRHYIAGKLDPGAGRNDILLPFNYGVVIEGRPISEGIWETPIAEFVSHITQDNEDLLLVSDSFTGNVWQINTGIGIEHPDGTIIPYSCEARTNWVMPTESMANDVSVCAFGVEGYISESSDSLTFQLYKDFNDSCPIMEFGISGTESNYVTGDLAVSFLGSDELGVGSVGAGGTPVGSLYPELDDEGRRHFKVLVFFPYEHGNTFSFGVRSSSLDNYSIIRFTTNPNKDNLLVDKIKIV
jgi:hypothetical protein